MTATGSFQSDLPGGKRHFGTPATDVLGQGGIGTSGTFYQRPFFAPDPLRTLLFGTFVSEIAPAPSQLVYLLSNVSIPAALHILSTRKIHSVPIYDNVQARFVGSLDVMDILSYIMSQFKPTETFATKEWVQQFFYQKTVMDCISTSSRNFWLELPTTANAMTALELLSRYGVERVPVMRNNQVESILTQSAMVKFLNRHKMSMLPWGNATVASMMLGSRTVFRVFDTDPVYKAFNLLVNAHASCVAVIDLSGLLVGNISPTDIKAAVDSASGIVAEMHRPFYEYRRQLQIPQLLPTTCSPEATFVEVVSLMATTGRHHIFLVNTMGELTGVITLSDLCGAVLNHLRLV
jgi:CBS domain-containing protein